MLCADHGRGRLERNDFYAYDYARNLLRSLPRNAVLYEPDDPTRFSIQVLQRVEHRRPDVVLLNFFRTRWGYEQIKRRLAGPPAPRSDRNGQELLRLLWTYSARRRPFYAELPQKLAPVPYRAEGLVYAAQEESSASSRERAETLLALYVQRGDFVTTHHSDFFTSHLISYYAAAQNNLGIEYANAGDWLRAVRALQGGASNGAGAVRGAPKPRFCFTKNAKTPLMVRVLQRRPPVISMTLLPIVKCGDSALRKKTADIPQIDDELLHTIGDMFRTMYAAPGIGLAANQVGLSRNFAVIDLQPGGQRQSDGDHQSRDRGALGHDL